jgi:hypothetical protein
MNLKSFFLYLTFLICFEAGFAQTSTDLSIAKEFANITNTRGNGTSAMQSYTSDYIDGSQFFFPDWKQGEIVTNNDIVFDNGYLFAYDKVRQEVFIRKQDSAVIIDGKKEDIKFFELKDYCKLYLMYFFRF